LRKIYTTQRIEKTYCNTVFRVEEVFGIPGEELGGDEAFMCIEDSAGPFPNSAV